ncbi:MAG TPA: tetratricopeptide repeat protein [Thermoanaerobaculia bacterium]|nr:tetratricopeptide repeat protein [Thermoanaerobaculia bacterium]
MNQRLTRKEIKRDDFTSAVGRGVEYAESHVMTIVYAVVGVLVLVALGVGIYYWRSHQAQAAGEALAKAVKVYLAPVVTTGAKPDDPAEPSFPTEEAHRAAAKKALEKVRSDYGSTDAADVAHLYLAQIAAEEGKLTEARKIWQDFVDAHPKQMLGAEARLNLIHLDRQQGKGEEVVKELRAMLEKGDNPVPQDALLHELGVTLEQLKRPQEAVQAYQRILDEFPQSPYRQEAQQKVTALDPARAASPFGGLSGLPGFPG